MSISAFSNRLASVVLVLSSLFLAKQALADENFKGQVLGGVAPIAKSTVTLWEASAGAPKSIWPSAMIPPDDPKRQFTRIARSGLLNTDLTLIF
jgi:hypothetical protein